MLKIIPILALALFCGFTTVHSQTGMKSKNLPNFFRVNDHLYRGGQPTKDGFMELKQLGVTTVINLRDNDDHARYEESLVVAAGLKFINMPLGNWDRPEVEEIDAIMSEIDILSNKPVFVHCKRGSDRTGTVMAVYRMTHDGWTGRRAKDEAKKFGIGWWQHGMRDFIGDYYRDHIQKNAKHS